MEREKTGILIAQARKERGLTQKDLAKRLHVSDRAVSKWERGVGFPDVSLLVPLAEALDLSVLELLQGERAETCDPEQAARLALASVQQTHNVKRKERWRLRVQVLLCFCLLWGVLGLFGLIAIPVNRSGVAGIYRDGFLQAYTVVRWEGRLQYRLPWRWEYWGHVQVPLVQVSVDPARDTQLAIPLKWDRVTRITHQSWYGNVRKEERPFIQSDCVYLDWFGNEFAFQLTDGSIIATSLTACSALEDELEL